MEYVHTMYQGTVAYLTIDNPASFNAVSAETAEQLGAALEKASDDDSIRCVVIRGANHRFCGGGDVKAMKQRIDRGRPDNRDGFRSFNRLINAALNCSKPVVAWVEGACAGAGVSLAMACDLAVAEETCKFALSFVNVGYVPDMGASTLLTRSVGKQRAARMFLLAEPFSGKQAYEWGLISHAVPAEEIETFVSKLVHKLANGPTAAYRGTKKLINRSILYGMEISMQTEAEYQFNLSYSEDHINSVSAFLEKKKPVYTGK